MVDISILAFSLSVVLISCCIMRAIDASCLTIVVAVYMATC